jgi:hypothetical protein
MSCVAPGFGSGAWGLDPWGGSLLPVAGGPIPSVAPFDVYCVGPCGPISVLLTYDEVMVVGGDTQFPVDIATMDQDLASGGAYPTTDAAIFINVAVPENFTFEFTVNFAHLPADFTDIINRHAYFGSFSPPGGCVGLFFSKIGIAYTGAVHLNGANSLVLDTPVQDLPNSQVLVSEGEYWTIRLAMSFSTGAVYIYVTRTSDLVTLGHQLRYVMPAIPSASAALMPPSETLVSVRGTLAAPTFLGINSICLGTGVIIPGLPPQANAGIDQAIALCSILQLDGTTSFDPQNAGLTYQWQLIDAPTGSQYIFDETDGLTFPGSPPTGFTNRLYSVSLGTLNALSSIPAGDVLVVGGQVFTILSTGSDIDGFFVRIEGFLLPDNLSVPTAFKYIRQNGFNTATSAKPTFYPDLPGIWKFSLVVFNGALFSEPVTVVINVVTSVVARGCTPDLSFLWNYLSDFWRLIEDRDRITTFWQGLAQVAAAELLNLWQVDYAKSLRDIQRTFQRRWLHYDLLMQENPNLITVSTVRAIFGGIESVDIPVLGLGGLAGTFLDLQLATSTTPMRINFQLPNPYSVVQLQGLLQSTLAQMNAGITVNAIVNRAGTITRLRIDAPFPITVLGTSTCPLYAVGAVNAAPTGTAGAGVVTAQTYRVERSLQFLDIQNNDFLCIDGIAYRIVRMVDDPSDPFLFQRVTLSDPLPVPTGATWTISGAVVSQDLDFWSGFCEQSDTVTFEVVNLSSQALLEVTGPVLGANATLTSSLPVDATSVGLYLSQPAIFSVFLKSVLRRRYVPIDPLVVDVPLLQEIIASVDDTQVLRRNVDFFFDTFRGQPCLRFITPVPADAGGPDVWQGQPPPERLWAETSYLDNKPRIEQNFGIAADFTLDDLAQLPSSVDYLSAVQGLWYTYFNGPTVFNIRAGAQILLGLPFAEETGTIVEIRDDFSTTTGRILVQDAANNTVVRSYYFPASLTLEINPATGKAYQVGDLAQQFAPLVTGVEVLDYINSPTWFQGYLSQGAFFEVEKFFRFLVRVGSPAFNLPALLFAQQFVLRIKPTYTYPLFVVLVTLPDAEVVTTDLVELNGTLIINDGGCFDGTLGVATMFDQARPAFGGWRSQFDHNANPLTPPTYPAPNYPIIWGFDKNYLCPEDAIVGTMCLTYASSTMPTMDSIYSYDLPIYTLEAALFADGAISDVVANPPGLQIGLPATIAAPGAMNTVSIELQASDVGTPNTYNLVLDKNGTPAATVPFTLTPGGFNLAATISLPVLAGDILTCFVQSTGSSNVEVLWSGILVTVGQAVSWAYDTPVPAGTYCVFKDL